VPPLDYPLVHALKRRLPGVPVVLNGGIATLDAMEEQLRYVDGVMIGRAAYGDPALLLQVDRRLFGDNTPDLDRREAIELFIPYVEARLAEGVPLHAMTRHILGLFNAWPGARAWRRHLATQGVKPGAGVEVLREALRLVRAPEAAAA
jgi:tRNA-dihydrouridine synthase A